MIKQNIWDNEQNIKMTSFYEKRRSSKFVTLLAKASFLRPGLSEYKLY
jgi:hypothetical protein